MFALCANEVCFAHEEVKRLMMCEGPNELKVMNILLENDVLIFTEDDLLGLTAYHARQIKSSTQVRMALNLYPGSDVLVMRVGDKQTDKLTIPADYKEKITGIEKYCTMPELEMLLIISEGLVREYERMTSPIMAGFFYAQNGEFFLNICTLIHPSSVTPTLNSPGHST